ncbi:MAG: hypothetical protein D6731_00935 [Planctomycetota bacterium]|nr:MAG: hypothetical protein D6731_00935 [Planctomycetota bacterium]
MSPRTLAALVPLFALAACTAPASNSPASEPTPRAKVRDPVEYVRAPGTHLRLGAARPGYSVEVRSHGPGYDHRSRISVVGEDATAWQVELEEPIYAGKVMGLLVRKRDGRILRALLGEPGSVGREVEVPTPAAASAEASDGVDEELTIAIGVFAARKVVQEGIASWFGREGELQDVLLKVDDPAQGPCELERMPEPDLVDVGDEAVRTLRFTYSNGDTYWDTEHPVVKALRPFGFGGRGRLRAVRMEPLRNTTEVVGIERERRPALRWP